MGEGNCLSTLCGRSHYFNKHYLLRVHSASGTGWQLPSSLYIKNKSLPMWWDSAPGTGGNCHSRPSTAAASQESNNLLPTLFEISPTILEAEGTWWNKAARGFRIHFRCHKNVTFSSCSNFPPFHLSGSWLWLDHLRITFRLLKTVMPRTHPQRFWFHSSGVKHWYF